MSVLIVAMIGWWATWFAYTMSVERGRHRGKSWGLWRAGYGKHKGEWRGWRVMITGWGNPRVGYGMRVGI